ncbi:MAG: permease [Eubacteriales bacterium]|nr:permease [Eubacteriales bacterium]
MNLFGGAISITQVSFLMFCLFAIAAVGYALGRITIKGISLGTAGVFVIAILFGCFLYDPLVAQLVVEEGGVKVDYATEALKIVDNIGLVLFVTSVGFIAGPKFFSNLKQNFKSYVLLGLIIIVTGGLVAAGCICIGRLTGEQNYDNLTAMVVGLLSGALTSTPAFTAARETAGDLSGTVVTGYGIAYLFGVIGVVLFVQLMPKLTKADMNAERKELTKTAEASTKKKYEGKLIHIDEFGIGMFALAAVIGIFVGLLKIGSFSLTTTGGCLLVSLIMGHFGRIGKISLMPSDRTLKVFREFGLMLFLAGAGVAGGVRFVAEFKPIYFLYGFLMTVIPMVIGYIFAKYVLKLSLLNNLGSITGGMTSTPALGTLINVAGTEDVAAAYAATYPIALISVVVVSQLLFMIF